MYIFSDGELVFFGINLLHNEPICNVSYHVHVG